MTICSEGLNVAVAANFGCPSWVDYALTSKFCSCDVFENVIFPLNGILRSLGRESDAKKLEDDALFIRTPSHVKVDQELCSQDLAETETDEPDSVV